LGSKCWTLPLLRREAPHHRPDSQCPATAESTCMGFIAWLARFRKGKMRRCVPEGDSGRRESSVTDCFPVGAKTDRGPQHQVPRRPPRRPEVREKASRRKCGAHSGGGAKLCRDTGATERWGHRLENMKILPGPGHGLTLRGHGSLSKTRMRLRY